MIRRLLNGYIYYCNRLQEHVLFFGNSKEEYITNNQFQDACSLVIIQLGEQVGRLSEEFKNENSGIDWNGIKGYEKCSCS